ncbi:MAG: hypothetical protein V3W20_09225, partial [Candidatus Neomarinimicrobiota bacterium]
MKIIPSIVFSVLILSMILPASAFLQGAGPLIYEMQLGSTQTLEWRLISQSSEDAILKIYVYDDDNSFVSIESEINLPAKQTIMVPVTVTIPKDAQDNQIIKSKIMAVMEGVSKSSSTVINIAMMKLLDIRIGDNPVLKETEKPIPKTTPKSDVVKDTKPPKESQPKSSFTVGGSNTK